MESVNTQNTDEYSRYLAESVNTQYLAESVNESVNTQGS